MIEIDENYEYKDALKAFRDCFIYESWGYKGDPIQNSKKYAKYMADNGNKGIRGANNFGLKMIRRAVYYDKNEGFTYNGSGYAHHYEDLLVLEPTMLIDPTVKLQYDKHYKPIELPICDDNEVMRIVKELLSMTNDEIMKKLGVTYPFSEETRKRLAEQDRETIRRKTEASLTERIELNRESGRTVKSHE